MPGPYTGSPKGLFFYGSIQGAAAQGATTADVWAAMRGAAFNTAAFLAGLTASAALGNLGVLGMAASFLAGVNIQDVNQMRAIAGQNIRAAQNLANAPSNYAISSEMIGIPPALGTGEGTGLPQQYSLRVNFTGTDITGAEVTDWYTIYGIDPSVTRGDLYNTALADAQARTALGAGSLQVVTLSSVNQIVLMQV
jgi:hypothetical protein